jgi:aspartate kinase
MKVYKFGGASVKDAEAVKNVCKILKSFAGEEILVVISAMAKTTNALELVWKAYINKDSSLEQHVKFVHDFHFNMIDELFSNNDEHIRNEVANILVELDWIVEEEPLDTKSYLYDQIVSLGELLSTKIVEAYLRSQGLNSQWLDARAYIQTDNTYREGKVDWDKTRQFIQKDIPAILKNKLIITQGFIGCTSENFTTTLGREGSDYSAAIFANCLDAESVTIWKDVPGVLTADPKLFPDAIKLDDIPYAEAIEMTYYGASVIHPKTIKPLQNKKIPLYVKAFVDPRLEGTCVGKKESVQFKDPIIIVKKNQKLLSISTLDFSFIAEENLSEIIGLISKHGVKINTMQNSAMTFSCCIDEDDKVEELVKEISTKYKVYYNHPLELITIRHYNDAVIKKIIAEKELLLEQRSRNTIQLVLR